MHTKASGSMNVSLLHIPACVILLAQAMPSQSIVFKAKTERQLCLQILLRWNLELHERALAPIVDAFRLIDDKKQGRLSKEQFFKFCNVINPVISEQEINTLLSTMAHCDSNLVTFSSCAHALVAELTKMLSHVHVVDAPLTRLLSSL